MFVLCKNEDITNKIPFLVLRKQSRQKRPQPKREHEIGGEAEKWATKTGSTEWGRGKRQSVSLHKFFF